MDQNLINELRAIELFAEDLRQKCYRARKKLESVYSPASSKKKKALSDQDVTKLLASRKRTILRKADEH